MKNYKAMSTIGYLIVVVILFAVCMIFSAPFLLEDNKDNSVNQDINPEFLKEQQVNQNNEIYEQRFAALENQINSLKSSSADKYVCTIEGKLDENGDIVPVENVTKNKKFVFVCEYRY